MDGVQSEQVGHLRHRTDSRSLHSASAHPQTTRVEKRGRSGRDDTLLNDGNGEQALAQAAPPPCHQCVIPTKGFSLISVSTPHRTRFSG